MQRTAVLSACAWLAFAAMGVESASAQSLLELDRAAMRYATQHPQMQNNGVGKPLGQQYATGVPGGTVINVTIPKAETGTNWNEPIAVQEPYDLANGGNRPLMISWHGHGISPYDFFTPGVTGLDEEANARGWLVLAMFAIDDQSMGCVTPIPAQTNVEAAVNYMLAHYPIDQDRIYMVGWSMGAGATASYAARHLDPSKPMIAAVALNAGAFDLVNTYNSEDNLFKTTAQTFFGGSPSNALFTFNYARAESEWFDFNTNSVLDSMSQLRNFKYIPVFHVCSTDDKAHLVQQNNKLVNYLTAKGATLTTQSFTGQIPPHSWNLLDPVATLNFLQTKTVVRQPAAFEVDADRSDTYYWARITQRTTNKFSQIVASTNAVTNAISATGVVNISALRLSPPAGTVDLTKHTTITFTTADVGATTLSIGGLTTPPTYILNGTSVVTNSTYLNGELMIPVPSGPGTFTFTLRFDVYAGVMTAPATQAINNTLALSLTGPTPNQAYFLMLGTNEGVLPLSLIDPSDDRNVLVGFNPFPIMISAAFGASPTVPFNVFIPNDHLLIGMKLYCQFVTYPGATHIIDAVSNRSDITFTP